MLGKVVGNAAEGKVNVQLGAQGRLRCHLLQVGVSQLNFELSDDLGWIKKTWQGSLM